MLASTPTSVVHTALNPRIKIGLCTGGHSMKKGGLSVCITSTSGSSTVIFRFSQHLGKTSMY